MLASPRTRPAAQPWPDDVPCIYGSCCVERVDFDWDDENIGHIDEHHVTPEEVEEAFADPDRMPATAHRGPHGQRRRGFFGATEDGRVLAVFFEDRRGMVRVATARDVTEAEFEQYNRRLR
jgi:uncharacterized DUF497 family protein